MLELNVLSAIQKTFLSHCGQLKSYCKLLTTYLEKIFTLQVNQKLQK